MFCTFLSQIMNIDFSGNLTKKNEKILYNKEVHKIN